MKRTVIAIGVTALCLSILIWKGSPTIYIQETSRHITVKARYVASLNDRPGLWVIDSIVEEGKYEYLKAQEMFVSYQGISLYDHLGITANWDCIICSGIDITGTVEKTLRGSFRFIADGYVCNFEPGQKCCSQSSFR